MECSCSPPEKRPTWFPFRKVWKCLPTFQKSVETFPIFQKSVETFPHFSLRCFRNSFQNNSSRHTETIFRDANLLGWSAFSNGRERHIDLGFMSVAHWPARHAVGQVPKRWQLAGFNFQTHGMTWLCVLLLCSIQSLLDLPRTPTNGQLPSMTDQDERS
jgi:hypothetical protein